MELEGLVAAALVLLGIVALTVAGFLLGHAWGLGDGLGWAVLGSAGLGLGLYLDASSGPEGPE